MTKIKLGIITNGSARTQYAKLDHVRLRNYFQSIIVSEEVKIKKPHADIFKIALEQLSVSADKAWFIGDHPQNDIVGASEAGLHSIWLKRDLEWDPILPNPKTIISTLSDLKTQLRH